MPPPPQLRDFTSLAFGHSRVHKGIACKDAMNRNQYMLTLALSFGMVDDLRLATLNRSTTADQQPSMSPSGHPIILLNCTFNPVPEVPGGLLGILLQAEPAVIRLTGNTRKVITDTGAATLLPEVEILMGRTTWHTHALIAGRPSLLILGASDAVAAIPPLRSTYVLMYVSCGPGLAV